MKQPSAHKPHYRAVILGLALGLAGLFFPASPNAQTIFVDQALSFGRFVLINTNTPIEIKIEADGSFSANSNLHIIDEPKIGEYTLQDGNANSTYTITVPEMVHLSGPGGNFILDEIVVKPDTLSTDENGESNFTLSGRLRSVGGGTHYGDGRYSHDMSIILNF